MDNKFITIVQKLIAEQGKEALFNAARGKSLIADYMRGEYKKESRLLVQAIEAGVAKAIDSADEIEICKLQQIRLLQDDYFLTREIASDLVDMLELVLRGKNTAVHLKPATPPSKPAPPHQSLVPQPASNIAQAEEYYNCGCDYIEKKDYDRAIVNYTEAIRLNPKDADFYNNRGAAYHKKEDLDRAIVDYDTALLIDPLHTNARYNRQKAIEAKKR